MSDTRTTTASPPEQRVRDTDAATCRHPDRDVPKLMCGYPLPCPHHTAIIDATVEPPTVTIPVTSDAMKLPARARLGQIGRALAGRVVVKRPTKRKVRHG